MEKYYIKFCGRIANNVFHPLSDHTGKAINRYNEKMKKVKKVYFLPCPASRVRDP